MLAIRLQRIGRKKSPSYRLVVSENARDTQGRALDIVGHYNPVATPKIVELKIDRIKHWLSQGAQASEAVNNLLIREGVVEGAKQKAVSISDKRHKKLNKKKEDAEAARVKAEEAKKAAAEAAKEVEAKAAEDAKAAAEAEATAKAEADAAPVEPAIEEVKEEVPAEATSEAEAVPEAEAPAEEEKKAE